MSVAARFANFYEALPKAYNYSHDYQVASMHRARIDAFRELVRSVPGERVLDAGCSAGGYLAVARLMGASLAIGVDLDTDALTRGRIWNEKHGLGTIRAVADVAAMPIQSETIDLAICSEVLEHVESPERVLSEIVRVLRPGGRAVISLPNVVSYHWGFERRLVRMGVRALLGRGPLDHEYLQHMEFPYWRTLNLIRSVGLRIEATRGVNCLPLNRTHVMPLISRRWPRFTEWLERVDLASGAFYPLRNLGSVLFVVASKA